MREGGRFTIGILQDEGYQKTSTCRKQVEIIPPAASLIFQGFGNKDAECKQNTEWHTVINQFNNHKCFRSCISKEAAVVVIHSKG